MFAKHSELILTESASVREKTYSKFYSGIIHEYFDIDEAFILKTKEILDSGNALSAFQSRSQPEYHECAYLLQFGVFDTCVAVQKFYESAMEYPKIIKMISCKELINICCLGTRSLFAVVGLCRVIEESVQQFGFSGDDLTHIQVFIIDKNRKWKRLSQYIVAAANKEYTKVKLKLDFLVADLTKDFSHEVILRIEKSHIVTIAKYLSNLSSADTVTRISQVTLRNMKKKAIFFYLDHYSEGQHHIIIKNLISKCTPFSEIKSSWEPEKYMLDEETKLFHNNLYQYISPLNLFWNTNIAPVIFSTWVKYPIAEVKNVVEIPAPITQGESDYRHVGNYRAKSSKNTLRNSTEKFRLVGKFATIDMEKKNKDDSNRHTAKDVAASRYANFDDFYND